MALVRKMNEVQFETEDKKKHLSGLKDNVFNDVCTNNIPFVKV